ncbi:hypothetical protein P9B03_13285 [Metasolibacillus meyeri]|uniref:Sporulation integral membrane protein YlbJ n=1 Tax=Metasolibacillus meyeri TaxID=1071052 RepID=A0AAW9NUC8_9BACL|nr:hypothetical protein [Metasolibacillus meyeri]MEC1179465.1 hypothetical protein [Metasolibacillus meyeri]
MTILHKILKRVDVITHFFAIFICFTLIILLLLFPGVAHEGADLGIHLFMEALFPYLLPYLILTSWLLRITGKYTAHPFLLYMKTYAISALGGFPTGAAAIAQLFKSKELSQKEAAILLGICHCPSPLFVIGFVSLDLINDVTIGWQYLIVLHIFSLLLLCIIYIALPHQKTSKLAQSVTARHAFAHSIKDSVPTVLIVCATIVFFTTIYAVLLHSMNHFFTLNNNLQIFFASLLEMTNGLQLMQQSYEGKLLLLALVTGLTAQSLSIHMQVLVIAKSNAIAFRPYIYMRLLYVAIIPAVYWLVFI